MFGIGLPEMIVILALALIVVGPDKLPSLARSAAKALHELKKTASSLKDQLNEDGNPLDELTKIDDTANSIKEDLIDDQADRDWTYTDQGVNPPPETDENNDTIIEAEVTNPESKDPNKNA